MRWWEQLDAPVLGRYRIERLLGEGGMARVFLATDVRADRPVAFKTPKLESFPPESVDELLGRFKREFRSMASDPIQGVIPIYESGEFTDDAGVVRPFLAMQYLSGGSLGDLLGGHIGQRTHRQTLGEVLDWLVPIARTVDRLHARKYLHRDIKPDNILFNSDGDPFLADLGIVGSLDPGMGGSMLGSTSMGVLGSPGSPGYQSPESIQADPALRNITASDQFSLAVTVYEALAGKLPVDAGTNQAWYGALMHWSPMPLSMHCPDLPAAASDAVMKAMSAQPSGRFTTCSEFAKALGAASEAPRVAPGAALSPLQTHAKPAQERTEAAARPTPPPAKPTREPWSNLARARIGAGIIAVVVVSVGLALGWAGSPPTGEDGLPTSGASPEPVASAGVESATTPPDPVQPEVEGPPWAVGFAADKSDLAPEAKRILDAAIAFLRRTPDARVLITGHADPTEGSAPYAMRMSERRAESVREHLVGNGIDGARLRSEARGRSRPLRPGVLADGTTDHAAVGANRRVELTLDTTPAPDTALAAASAPDAPDKESAPDRPEAKPSRADMKNCPAPFQELGVEQSIIACTNIIDLPGVGAANKTFALLHRGRNHAINEDYASADKDFSLAIELAPTSALRASALDARGKARLKAGKTDAGESDLAKARQSGAVATVKPISTGERSFLGTDWKRCLAYASSADGGELLYALSEVMDVRPTPRFLEQIQNEQPHRPVLLAAGAKPETIAFACTSMNTFPKDAREEMDRTLAKFLSDSRGRFSRTRKLESTWTVRGTGRE
jgi:serine/threonine protein kinase